MELYCLLDKSAGRVLDIFFDSNDANARLRMAQALFACKNPIGLDKRFLVNIGSIDMENGTILAKKPKEVVCLNVLYKDVLKEKKKYEC